MKLLLEPEIRAEHKEEPGSCFGDSNDQVQGHLACTVLVLRLTMTPCARLAGGLSTSLLYYSMLFETIPRCSKLHSNYIWA